MKQIVALSLGVLVTFALVSGTYADQGQAGSGESVLLHTAADQIRRVDSGEPL